MTLENRIDDIPYGGGWWKSAGRDMFLELAREMMRKGLTEEDAIGILTSAYCTVAAEFGN